MSLTPKKDNSQQVLHGTIYSRFEDSIDSEFIYHCYAYPNSTAKDEDLTWTIWREFTITNQITCPYDAELGRPRPDGWSCDDRESIGYWNDFPLDPPPDGFQYIIDENGQYLKDLDTKEFLLEAI